MPRRQAKKGEPLTFGDRIVTALLGGLCAFGTMLFVWFLVMYAGGRAGEDVMMPFAWVWGVSLGVAAVAFVAGPERTMDVTERVWRVFGTLFFGRQ